MERHARRGFTLIEVLIAVALLATVAAQVSMLVGSATQHQKDVSLDLVLDDQARVVLDRIAYAIMSADRDTLFLEAESPFSSSQVRFAVSLGVEDGEVVWDDPEEIELTRNDTQVLWRQNPDEIDERRVAWCNIVRPFMQGEIPNGVDDNGNGLVDEQGLSFALDRNSVTIRLTLQRLRADGTATTVALETQVTCRN